MDKFVIRGGNPLIGTIRVSGAKNSALPCMAAAILTEDEVVLENIPQVRDIETERKLLVSMGAGIFGALIGGALMLLPGGGGRSIGGGGWGGFGGFGGGGFGGGGEIGRASCRERVFLSV